MQGPTTPSQHDGIKRQHNPDTFRTAFFNEHRQLVSRLARSAAHRNPSVDRDDLRQVADIALWQAVSTYDEAKGYPFQHYASVCITHALMKSAAAERAQSAPSAVDVDELQDKSECDGAEPQQGQNSAHGQRYFGDAGAGEPYQNCLMNEIALFVGGLQPQLREVYHRHLLGGIPQTVLARDMGVSQQRVATLKAALRTHLLEMLVTMD